MDAIAADGAGHQSAALIPTSIRRHRLFSTGNFQGASAAQLTDARDLYALLTGRVGAVTGLAALNPDTGQYKTSGFGGAAAA